MNIAVTGGMGSGKTEVARVLSEMLGARLVSADHICRDLLSAGREGWLGLKKIAPSDCFAAGGEIDRAVLRKAIFTDERFRRRVDDVIHPMVRDELRHFCEKSRRESVPLVAEVPLLFEKGWQADFDCTLLVYAEDEVCVNRVMQRDLVSRVDAKKSIAAQMLLEEKRELADYVVNNSSAFAETIKQVEHLVKMHSFEKKAAKNMKNT